MIYELHAGDYIVKSVSETLKLNLLVTPKVFFTAADVMWCFKWSQLQFVWFVILFRTLGGVRVAGWIQARATVLSPIVWVNVEAWTVVKGACTCPNLVSPCLTIPRCHRAALVTAIKSQGWRGIVSGVSAAGEVCAPRANRLAQMLHHSTGTELWLWADR